MEPEVHNPAGRSKPLLHTPVSEGHLGDLRSLCQIPDGESLDLSEVLAGQSPDTTCKECLKRAINFSEKLMRDATSLRARSLSTFLSLEGTVQEYSGMCVEYYEANRKAEERNHDWVNTFFSLDLISGRTREAHLATVKVIEAREELRGPSGPKEIIRNR